MAELYLLYAVISAIFLLQPPDLIVAHLSGMYKLVVVLALESLCSKKDLYHPNTGFGIAKLQPSPLRISVYFDLSLHFNPLLYSCAKSVCSQSKNTFSWKSTSLLLLASNYSIIHVAWRIIKCITSFQNNFLKFEFFVNELHFLCRESLKHLCSKPF